MNTINLSELADQIIAGKRLNSNDDLSFFIDCDLTELCKSADKIRQHFVGPKVDLCAIINGKSGKCSEDCKYCAQSAHNHTNCQVYEFLEPEEILKAALEHEAEGVHRFSIVTAGKALSGTDFQKALDAYKLMNAKCKIDLCASHGFLTREQFRELKAAGVTRYHHNIETSERYFPSICSTHTFQMKKDTIKIAQEEGLAVCSGGIIGMGENWEDRISMATTLAELNIKSIPINALMPIKGTSLENQPQLTEDEILRTIAFFRFINPEANIRLAAGRALITDCGMKAFDCGASATITGNMLTTSGGSTIQTDKEKLSAMGRQV